MALCRFVFIFTILLFLYKFWKVFPSSISRYRTYCRPPLSNTSLIAALSALPTVGRAAGLSLVGQVGYGATGTVPLIVGLWCPQVIARPSSHPSVIRLRASIALAAALRKTRGSIGSATQTAVREITVQKQLKLMLLLRLLSNKQVRVIK